jgi:hypothetical protein
MEKSVSAASTAAQQTKCLSIVLVLEGSGLCLEPARIVHSPRTTLTGSLTLAVRRAKTQAAYFTLECIT